MFGSAWCLTTAQIQFSLKKTKLGRPEHSLIPNPLRPITPHFFLSLHPPKSGRHMCITPINIYSWRSLILCYGGSVWYRTKHLLISYLKIPLDSTLGPLQLHLEANLKPNVSSYIFSLLQKRKTMFLSDRGIWIKGKYFILLR